MHSNRLSYIITLTINVVHEHTKRSVSVGTARCLHIQGYGSSLISSARSKSRAHKLNMLLRFLENELQLR